MEFQFGGLLFYDYEQHSGPIFAVGEPEVLGWPRRIDRNLEGGVCGSAGQGGSAR